MTPSNLRCRNEASQWKHESNRERRIPLVLYAEPDDVLKGAWTELGAALACGVPVFAVGIEKFTVANHVGITHCATIDEAMRLARSLPKAEGEDGSTLPKAE